MSDPMMGRGKPPMANQGQAQQAAQGIRANRSILNPTDAASMAQTGDISPNMTIAQFFSNFGIDVNKDPVTDLAKFAQSQMQKANPIGKMLNMGSPGGSPGSSPSPGGGQAPSPPPSSSAPPGLGGLMSQMRG
jgi:hypothetical protein